MIKLLLGGSPCTYWSIAQTKSRETTAAGIGWELFKNYLIAKEKFNPDYFIYENNVSAAQAIKNQIKQELNVYDGTFFMQDTGARYIEINSALVSAQNRNRFYVHNCGEVGQPQDRQIYIWDILDTISATPINPLKSGKSRCVTAGYAMQGVTPILESNYSDNPHKQKWDCITIPLNTTKNNKAQCIRATCYKDGIRNLVGNNTDKRTCVAEPIGYAKPTEFTAIGIPTKAYCYTDDKIHTVYEVKDGNIIIKHKKYPIALQDGFYIIRKLTVSECCRLQTLPPDYCRAVAITHGYKGVGNGWTADVIIHILQHALKGVPKTEKITVLSMYDGIGTGRYCLAKMGFCNVEYYAYEIDDNAIQIALSNYPDIKQCGDAFQLRSALWRLPIDK